MLLTFVASTKEGHTGSISKWKGVTVILPTGETGSQNVMFTGHARNSKALFCKIITKDTKKVRSLGFITSGSMCTTDAFYLDQNKQYQYFTPGLLNRTIYSANHVNSNSGCLSYPSLLGIYYIGVHKGKEVCIGVEDPSMFTNFIKHNTQMNLFKEKHQFKINTDIVFKSYSDWEEATVIECLAWNFAKVQCKSDNRVIKIDLQSIKL